MLLPREFLYALIVAMLVFGTLALINHKTSYRIALISFLWIFFLASFLITLPELSTSYGSFFGNVGYITLAILLIPYIFECIWLLKGKPSFLVDLGAISLLTIIAFFGPFILWATDIIHNYLFASFIAISIVVIISILGGVRLYSKEVRRSI